jgi:hypothetical protein
MTQADLKSAVLRGIRTFVAAFIAVYPAPAIIGAFSGSQPLDTSALRAAAVAGVAALVSLVWRLFIDPLPVPTLADKNPAPPSA